MANQVTTEDLLEERDNLKATIKNILEGGQEFQTRDGRVRQANLQTLYDRLGQVENAIAAAECDGGANTVLLKFEGVG